MDPMIVKLELPQLMNDALSPLAQNIGKTLCALWDIVFGKVEFSAEKLQYKRCLALEEFKNKLSEQVSNIPDEKLIEPSISIVGPALEASKYYFDEDCIKDMFSKLIANSMHADLSEYVHNSFVEIIKQMSPLDAENISYIHAEHDAAVCRFNLPEPDGESYINVLSLVFLRPDQEEIDLDKNAVSLINLQRLGLIELSYSVQLTDESLYDRYFSSQFTKFLLENGGEIFDDKSGKPFVIKKGKATITPYGYQFACACL